MSRIGACRRRCGARDGDGGGDDGDGRSRRCRRCGDVLGDGLDGVLDLRLNHVHRLGLHLHDVRELGRDVNGGLGDGRQLMLEDGSGVDLDHGLRDSVDHGSGHRNLNLLLLGDGNMELLGDGELFGDMDHLSDMNHPVAVSVSLGEEHVGKRLRTRSWERGPYAQR